MEPQVWSRPELTESRWRDLMRRSHGWLYRTGYFKRFLSQRGPDSLTTYCRNPWPGDAARGNALFQGNYDFAGEKIYKPNQPPWFLNRENQAWMAALHGFDWLGDLAAVDAAAARLLAQRMVLGWIDAVRRYEPVIWSSEVTAARVIAWCRHGEMLTQALEARHRQILLRSLAGQYRYLKWAAGHARAGRPRLLTAVALISAALALGVPGKELEQAVVAFKRELTKLVGRDGAFAVRAPDLQLNLVRDLVGLLGDLRRARHGLAESLSETLEGMVTLLQLLRHGDGSLAVFNGSQALPTALVDLTVDRSGASYQAAGSASAGGFQRLAAERTVVLVDAGPAIVGQADPAAGRSALSFELSFGPNRVVVNGARVHPTSAEDAADDEQFPDSSGFIIAGAAAKRASKRRAGKTVDGRINCRRHEDEANSVWLETVHGGFQDRYGVLHQRRFFLDGDGSNLRGEDVLLRANDGFVEGQPCRALFHLHPDVQASVLQGGAAIILRLPTGSGWRFRCDGGDLALAEGHYFGEPGQSRRCQSIIVRAATKVSGTKLRWVFHRIG